MPKRKAENGRYDTNLLESIALEAPPETGQETSFALDKRQLTWPSVIGSKKAKRNVKKEEWRYILYRLREREAAGKVSTVKVSDFVVPPSRIQKQSRIHGYQTTLQRHVGLSRPSTPLHVSIMTPPPVTSPAARHLEMHVEPNIQEPPKTARLAGTPLLTPMSVFQTWFDTFIGPDSVHRLPLILQWRSPTDNERLRTRINSNDSILLQLNPSNQRKNREARLQTGQDDSLRFQPVLSEYDHYLSVGRKARADTATPYVNIFKETVGLLSNDVDLSAYLRGPSGMVGAVPDILRVVLHQKHYTIAAFAEKLFVLAVQRGHCELIRALLCAGVDANSPGFRSEGSGPITALQALVSENQTSLLPLILSRNPVDCSMYQSPIPQNAEHAYSHARRQSISWRAQLKCHNGRGYVHENGTVFDIAVGKGDYNLTNLLLSWSREENTSDSVTLRTLRLAVLQDRRDLVNVLVTNHPEIIVEAKKKPWKLLEAASTCKHATMFNYLLSLGLNMYASNEQQIGSALAAACAHGNMELVDRLLTANVDGNRRAAGLSEQVDPDVCYLHESKLKRISGLCALNLAVLNSNEPLIKILMRRDTNLNPSPGLRPIFLAAWTGDAAIVKLLIQSGAALHQHLASDDYEVFFNATNFSLASNSANYSAIRLAFERGNLDVIKILYESGERLFPTQADMDPLEPDWDPFAFTLGGWADRLRIREWDPWTIAIRRHSPAFLRAMMLAPYITQAMSSAHVSMGIVVHGVTTMQELLHENLVTWQDCADPSILYALIYRGHGDLVRRALNEMFDEFGRDYVTQAYGPRALSMAVIGNNSAMIHSLLELGFCPYAKDPATDDKYSWRVDRWYQRPGCDEEEIPCLAAIRYPEPQAYSTALETAVWLKRYDILRSFLWWRGSGPRRVDELVRREHLGAAYVHAMCTGQTHLKDSIAETGVTYTEASELLGLRYIQEHLSVGILFLMRRRSWKQAEVLLDLIQDPNMPDTLEDVQIRVPTALQIATHGNQVDLVKKLLEKGADVNAKPSPNGGATALQYATKRGNFEMTRLLVEAGAEINAAPADYNGRTAIEGAAESGRLDMVWYLLGAGADVERALNINYRRAAYRALTRGHNTIFRMIQDWKRQKYGLEDCDDVQSIESLTQDELMYANDAMALAWKDNGTDFGDSDDEDEMSEDESMVGDEDTCQREDASEAAIHDDEQSFSRIHHPDSASAEVGELRTFETDSRSDWIHSLEGRAQLVKAAALGQESAYVEPQSATSVAPSNGMMDSIWVGSMYEGDILSSWYKMFNAGDTIRTE